jgi:hypothetical protein
LTTIRGLLRHSAIFVALMMALSGRLVAQHTHDHADTAATAQTPHKMDGMDMSGADGDWKMAAMAKHMAYSRPRPLTAADSVRATRIVSELRQAVAKYQDVKVAEADGYEMFAPQIKNQPQYHFTKKWNAIRNQFGFDPARPTSLLYKKDAQGQLHLIGAMYTASKGTSEDALNDRVPLSVAHWHRHINWCVPPLRQKERWSETKDGRPVFGPLGVETREECRRSAGWFTPTCSRATISNPSGTTTT